MLSSDRTRRETPHWTRSTINRDELTRTLNAQRQRRQPAAPHKPKAASRLLLLGTAILFIGTAVLLFTPLLSSSWPVSSQMAMSDKRSSNALLRSTTIHPTSTTEPVRAFVCTRVPNGRLYVRTTPGTSSSVQGYLSEGQEVLLLDNVTVEHQGGLWLQINSPINGWANARFICKGQ